MSHANATFATDEMTLSTADGPDVMPAIDPIRPAIQWSDLILGGVVLAVMVVVVFFAVIH